MEGGTAAGDRHRDARARVPGAPIYTTLAEAVLRVAREVLGEDARLEPLAQGVSSLNYRAVSSAGQHVMRLDLYRSHSDVALDFVLADACRARGVAVPPSSVWLGEVHGLPLSIRKYVRGSTLSELTTVPAEVYRIAGSQLGLLHSTHVECDRPWFYAEPLGRPGRMLLPNSTLVKRARATLSESRSRLDSRVWATGLVHTDFRKDNLVLQRGRIVVLDWEKAAIGVRLFDMALALFHVATEPDEWWPDALIAFLHGYGEARSATPVERAGLADMMACAASVYYLVDAEIWQRETAAQESLSELDERHVAYFTDYCSPRFAALLDRWDAIRALLDTGPFPAVRG